VVPRGELDTIETVAQWIERMLFQKAWHAYPGRFAAQVLLNMSTIHSVRFTMTFSKKTLLATLLAGAGLMGLHTGSYAAVSTEPGSICKPYGWSNKAGVYASASGTYNFSGFPTEFICPVVRASAVPSTGWGVWLDGYISLAGEKTTCYIYSFNYTGAFIGTSAPFTVTAPTNNYYWDHFAFMTWEKTPDFSSQSVYCSVPNNGAIVDVEPSI
jgi:hypothetical protein